MSIVGTISWIAPRALFLIGVIPLGCQKQENPVLSNEQFPAERYPANVLLNPEQEGAIVAAMRATAEGMPTHPLTAAADAVRWSDVKAAASAAITAAEMGLKSSTLVGETWTFEIKTQGGEPAKLTVVRQDPPQSYLATATVGSFGEQFDNAERVVREFRMAMRRYGALKRPS
ncbi:MAG: hypothetical protein EXS01_05575 [Phycisphaerales bacterium]|nr:hypothetical protein [Phycisphaerales bacterium]